MQSPQASLLGTVNAEGGQNVLRTRAVQELTLASRQTPHPQFQKITLSLPVSYVAAPFCKNHINSFTCF